MDREVLLSEINRLLKVNGDTVRAIDVIDSVPHDTLVKTIAYVLTVLSSNNN